jgi:hypothetical protein
MEVPDIRSGDARRLAEIFSWDSQPEVPWSDDDLAAILSHQLSVPCEAELGATGQLAALPVAAGAPSASRPGTFADLFRSTDPPIELLRAVKEFAKATRTDPQFSLPREVAGILYSAAIAVALVRCNERISGLSDEGLQHGFAWAAQQPWVPDDLRAVFGEALKALRLDEFATDRPSR